ncbi:MAG TPA: hypothetical protein VGX92_16825 [Pyrinomonadaceae bacterium]|jgi:hypothetical protein|nr:hypothetical protein [Pyrinomonadaceae bacterium]
MKSCVFAAVLILLPALAGIATVRACQVPTHGTRRYYSVNRKYFVKVDEGGRAALYRNGRRSLRLWENTLPQLPGYLLVSNDGNSIVMIERYGCAGSSTRPETPVIFIYDESGKEVNSFTVAEVAHLSQPREGISLGGGVNWYHDSRLTPAGELIVQTQVTRLDRKECPEGMTSAPSTKGKRDPYLIVRESLRCYRTVPYERLRFDTATGRLLDRARI